MPYFFGEMTMKTTGPSASLNLKQLNAEFDQFLDFFRMVRGHELSWRGDQNLGECELFLKLPISSSTLERFRRRYPDPQDRELFVRMYADPLLKHTHPSEYKRLLQMYTIQRKLEQEQEAARVSKGFFASVTSFFLCDLPSTYCEDITFAWNLLNTNFFQILLFNAKVMIALVTVLLILISVAMISDVGLVCVLGMLVAGAVEIVIKSLAFFILASVLTLPGMVSLSRVQMLGEKEPLFIDGYLFLLKIILLTPIAGLIALGTAIYSLFSEKFASKAADQPKKQQRTTLAPSPPRTMKIEVLEEADVPAAGVPGVRAGGEVPGRRFRPNFSYTADDLG